ncbi:MAG: c-type cytochrome [Flavitalea sp.]
MNISGKSNFWLYTIFAVVTAVILFEIFKKDEITIPDLTESTPVDTIWHAPLIDIDAALAGERRDLVVYGEELIRNTAAYLGPNGSVKKLSNGMNCQNCHLDAGTRPFGNNFSAVNSTYPKFRERSGKIENIHHRVSDCFERSLNGSAPDSTSKEYLAIEAYINWLGKDVPKGIKPAGSGINKLQFLDRAADPLKGKEVYAVKCQVCHSANGEGVLNETGKLYTYPPLWGKNSYNNGAGLFRLSNFAGFIKYNMPLGVTHNSTQLSDEEAWDLAAFVNSRPRPVKNQAGDWPNPGAKPFDFPFGPYADNFTEKQHKYGPFKPILEKGK